MNNNYSYKKINSIMEEIVNEVLPVSMHQLLAEEPFVYTELTETMDCTKEAVDLGAVENEEIPLVY